MNKPDTSIIIGYDGSPQSEDAIVLAKALAETTAAHPLVVAAVTWPVYLMGQPDLDRAVHAQLDPVLEVAAERLSGLEVRTEALHTRSVPQDLIRLAEREDAASIVIGSSRHGTFGRVALGSVGTSLIHGAPCAVTVAHHGLAQEGECRLLKIGVAFDGTPESTSALETGIGIALRSHAELTVLTIVEPTAYGLNPPPTIYTPAVLGELEKAEMERVLNVALGKVPEGLPVDGRLLTGPAGRVIPEVSSDFDLLVMGSRGYGPVGRTFLGSVATHVIHASRCPVMVLPRGSGSDPFRLEATHETPL